MTVEFLLPIRFFMHSISENRKHDLDNCRRTTGQACLECSAASLQSGPMHILAQFQGAADGRLTETMSCEETEYHPPFFLSLPLVQPSRASNSVSQWYYF